MVSSTQTREVVSSLPEGHLSHPLVVQPLTSAQWATVDMINDALTKEYSIRRKMLLTRCDVTVQSFMWSDKGQVCVDVYGYMYMYLADTCTIYLHKHFMFA